MSVNNFNNIDDRNNLIERSKSRLNDLYSFHRNSLNARTRLNGCKAQLISHWKESMDFSLKEFNIVLANASAEEKDRFLLQEKHAYDIWVGQMQATRSKIILNENNSNSSEETKHFIENSLRYCI